MFSEVGWMDGWIDEHTNMGMRDKALFILNGICVCRTISNCLSVTFRHNRSAGSCHTKHNWYFCNIYELN